MENTYLIKVLYPNYGKNLKLNNKNNFLMDKISEHLTKDDIQRENKHMKIGSKLFVIREL